MRTLEEMMKDMERGITYLTQWGFLPATSGNISLRYGDIIYITPSGVDKKEIKGHRMIRMNLRGEVLFSPEGFKPSSEWRLHLKIYQELPKANVILHLHPTYALIYASIHDNIDIHYLPEGMELFKGERVGILRELPPGTQEFADEVAKAFKEGYRGVIIRRHGIVIWDEESLLRSAYRVETIERTAKLLLLTDLFRK